MRGLMQRLTGTVHAMPEPNKHIDGAIMLINLRGRQNLASETARTLFSYVKVSLVSTRESLQKACIPWRGLMAFFTDC